MLGKRRIKMNSEPVVIQTIANVLIAIVALAALIVALLVERRNQARFEENLHQSRILAQANIKPLLTISSEIYEHSKSVRLINRGIGTAVITKVEFSRGEQKTTDLSELFRINGKFKWETFRRLPPTKVFVSPNETIDLVRLSAQHLDAQGISEQETRSILSQWQRQKSGIQILLEYEDVLGNRQPACEETLK
jgi:hypothetical protein